MAATCIRGAETPAQVVGVKFEDVTDVLERAERGPVRTVEPLLRLLEIGRLHVVAMGVAPFGPSVVPAMGSSDRAPLPSHMESATWRTEFAFFSRVRQATGEFVTPPQRRLSPNPSRADHQFFLSASPKKGRRTPEGAASRCAARRLPGCRLCRLVRWGAGPSRSGRRPLGRLNMDTVRSRDDRSCRGESATAPPLPRQLVYDGADPSSPAQLLERGANDVFE